MTKFMERKYLTTGKAVQPYLSVGFKEKRIPERMVEAVIALYVNSITIVKTMAEI